jgi:hypothetical protein
MKKKNRSRIYDLGVVPTRGNNFNPLSDIMRCFDLVWRLIQILYGKPSAQEFSPDTKFPNFSGFKISAGHGTKPRRFTIGFVAACVNGNMNPVLKRSSFVMNPKTFALM